MSDELDPGLRRLFASTAEAPADEAFVAAVTGRTTRAKRLRLVGRALAGALIVVVLAVAGSMLVPLLNQGAAAIGILTTSSPLGVAAGVALTIAGVVCVRALGPLLGRMRF